MQSADRNLFNQYQATLVPSRLRISMGLGKKIITFLQIFIVLLIGFISQIFIQDVFHKYALDVIFEAFFKQLPFDINS